MLPKGPEPTGSDQGDETVCRAVPCSRMACPETIAHAQRLCVYGRDSSDLWPTKGVAEKRGELLHRLQAALGMGGHLGKAVRKVRVMHVGQIMRPVASLQAQGSFLEARAG